MGPDVARFATVFDLRGHRELCDSVFKPAGERVDDVYGYPDALIKMRPTIVQIITIGVALSDTEARAAFFGCRPYCKKFLTVLVRARVRSSFRPFVYGTDSLRDDVWLSASRPSHIAMPSGEGGNHPI